jgi:hypothetical protein
MSHAGEPLTEGKIVRMFEQKRAENQGEQCTRLMYQMAQQSFQTGKLDKMDAFTLLSDSVELTPTMEDWLDNLEETVQSMG